jgi:nucleoside 2-deoxyribosyltransferase
MSSKEAVPISDTSHVATITQVPLSVYAAGGMFTQHELSTNVYIKEAVWKLSRGRFQLLLPQSKELRESEMSDLAMFIRNADLYQVTKADMLIARFDGLELDTGTVIEFIWAKILGKPAVILRCDSRRSSSADLDEPYNLMVKNWPRTVEVQINSLMQYIRSFAEKRVEGIEQNSFQGIIDVELNIIRKGVGEIARKIIEGLEEALLLKSPYPFELKETIYKTLRHSPAGGFDKMLSESELEKIIHRLRENGTL